MQTKYDVGQTVLLKVEVKSINLIENDIVYTVAIPNKKTPIKVSERHIAGKVPERHIAGAVEGDADGSKTGRID